MENTNSSIVIRKATAADIPDVIRLRRMMFESMGETDQARLDALDVACGKYFPAAFESGAFHAWLAVTESGWAVAAGGAVIDQHPPTVDNTSGKSAYIMNVVTEPDYRRQGLARKIMQAILRWVSEQNISRAMLIASEDGAPLYEMLGFKSVNAMQINLVHESQPKP